MIKLAPTCVGDTSTRSVKISNHSKIPQHFEVYIPPLSDLQVMPSAGVLSKGQYTYLSVQFTPTNKEHTNPSKWKLSCISKPNGKSKAEEVHYIEVHTWTVPRIFAVTPSTLSFETVPIGTRSSLTLSIENLSESTVELCSPDSILASCFTVLNALRPMAPGATQLLTVQFCPDKEQEVKLNYKVGLL
jgi:hypothetical protein